MHPSNIYTIYMWLLLGLGVVSLSLVTTAITLGSVYGLTPCQFCLWQRYPHFVVIALASIGGVASTKATTINITPYITYLLLLAIVAMLVASGLGFWHVAIEMGWVIWLGECASLPDLTGNTDAVLDSLLDTKPTRCDTPQWHLFGISMAGWNAGVSLATALIAIIIAIASQRQHHNHQPN